MDEEDKDDGELDSLEEGEEIEIESKPKGVSKKQKQRKVKTDSAQGIVHGDLDEDEYPIVSEGEGDNEVQKIKDIIGKEEE